MAFTPKSCGVDQSSLKSGPSIIMSQVVTTLAPSTTETAESSPGGTITEDAFGRRGKILASVPRSPNWWTVSDVSAMPPR